MNRYLVQEQLGDGTFGTVFRAIRRVDNNEVSQMLPSESIFSIGCVHMQLSCVYFTLSMHGKCLWRRTVAEDQRSMLFHRRTRVDRHFGGSHYRDSSSMT